MPESQGPPEHRAPGGGREEGAPPGTAGGRGGPPPAEQPTVTALPSPGGHPQPPQQQPYGPPGPGWTAPPPAPGHGYAPGYGYPAGYGYAWTPPPPPPSTSGICTAAMVLGIISVFLVTTVYGMVVAILTSPFAIGLGLSARRRIKRGQAYGSGQATAGLVLGIVSFVVCAAVATLIVLAITVWSDDRESDDSGETGHTYNAQAAATAVPAAPAVTPAR
ncbi:MAG TPA: DUF4190 domain-containing protein [Streptomyces sp.]|nr:DUF4190 domain-containing protein [Streptomyces sp.]